MGGGDGLALREVLKYSNIERVALVDIDPDMTKLFATHSDLATLNAHAFADQRVKVFNADAALWLEGTDEVFDLAILDFPDPSNFSLGKLYSVPFYRLLYKHISENGLVTVQSTSPYYAPKSYAAINATLQAAAWLTVPYHCYVPSFGEWGFVIAAKQPGYTPPEKYEVPLRFLDGPGTQLMFSWPRDMPLQAGEPNRLNTQSLVRQFEQDWDNVIR
jgi:spermidine synthase